MLHSLGGYTKLPASFNSLGDSFSPARILFQIVILQCFYYVAGGLIFMLTAFLCGYEFSFDWVFSYKFVDIQNALGLTLFCLWLFDSLLCVLFMTIIIGRSKLAWDFALTVHFINFLVCWVYARHLPDSFLWWCLQVLSCVLLVSLGTYTTRWKELRQTFFEDMVDPELGNVHHNGDIESFELQTMKSTGTPS